MKHEIAEAANEEMVVIEILSLTTFILLLGEGVYFGIRIKSILNVLLSHELSM